MWRHMTRIPRVLAVLLVIAALVASGCATTGAPGAGVPATSATTPPTLAPMSAPAALSEDLDGAADPSARPPIATTSPAATAVESVPPLESAPPPDTARGEPFAINLFRRGDYVRQFTFEWCVGASIQMALNMVRPEDDTTRATQQRVWEMARDRSFSPFGGANPVGWVATLNELDIGRYELVSIPSFEEALRVAATALAETDRPVGLVMWRGRHAWMMSGFEATADPREAAAFDVTAIRVLDPLYPHGSSVWGPSPRPNSVVRPDVLGEQFVERTSGRVNLGVPPGYLLVLPRAA